MPDIDTQGVALEPCPFCGCAPKLRRIVEEYAADADGPAGEYDAWFRIQCDNCGAEQSEEYRSDAIAAWNRRAYLSAVGGEAGELARLREENETYRTAFDGIEPTAQEGREAVAWLTEGYGYKRVFLEREAAEKLARGGDGTVSPLYSHPAPAQPAAQVVWVITLPGGDIMHETPTFASHDRAAEWGKGFWGEDEWRRGYGAKRVAIASPTDADAAVGEWRDDPSADERWCAGLDYGQTQLCNVLGVDPATIDWDAATETLDGDVQAVIGKILTARFGEDWPSAFTAAKAGEDGR